MSFHEMFFYVARRKMYHQEYNNILLGTSLVPKPIPQATPTDALVEVA